MTRSLDIHLRRSDAMTWFLYDGENGIEAFFDPIKNKSKKHFGDDYLVPFKTKVDKNRYEDFSGVVGEFSRLISGTTIKKNYTVEDVKVQLKEKVKTNSKEEFEVLFDIVKDVYFRDGQLVPISAKSLSLITSNVTQRQVAEYLYSIFVLNSDLKNKYLDMSESEDTNALEKCLYESLGDTQLEAGEITSKGRCYIPYIRDVFIKDIGILMTNADDYKDNVQRLLAYYYMTYVNQLSVKLHAFGNAERYKMEKIFLTLNWETGFSRVRPGYEFGWKMVLNSISHMFSHAVVMQLLSKNVEGIHYDYLSIFERFNETAEDKEVAKEVRSITERYEQWIDTVDFSGCHYGEPTSTCETLNEVKRLFETIDYQFLNSFRTSHYNGYNKKYIEFVQKNFGKRRGPWGYTIGVSENDIIMFTKIILAENNGKIKLSMLFDKFEDRGLVFDRESKQKITELFEKMNYLEKRSDSGDAQYVKSVL